ncbi:hypothetical protein MKW92_021046 [Papaver armeniacum]|nr:hypothetical protein MKW92_021046 [Papaver armeniacum]
MDSINSFKGYGKVDEAEERAFRQKTRRRITIITVSTIILLIVVIACVAGVLIRKKTTESSSSPSAAAKPLTLSQSIKAVCSVTQYPDSCFASISSMYNGSSNNPVDPKELFLLSLKSAVKELSGLTSLPDDIISGKINGVDRRVENALLDCKSLFDDAIDELNSSISSITNGGHDQDLLSTGKIENIKTWLSSAITDQETCLDGLTEMNTSTPIHDRVESAMKNSTEFTSNSLAIVAKILPMLEKFKIPIHRQLMGHKQHRFISAKRFPEWVHPRDRRLLLQDDQNVISPDLTVDQNGGGDFKTIQEAISTVKKKNDTRVVIYVKAGKYVENVIIDKGHWNIMMYGDGKDKTIVSGSLNNIDGTPTFSTATFVVTGRGFIAKGIRFENTAGPAKHQAVALRSGSDRSVFYQCSFDGYQDTLYAHSNRQFYRDCDITGTIDFIFGNAAVVLQNCLIQPRQPMANQFNTITAQGKKDPNQNTGISIQKCTIKPFGVVSLRTYLGRPWKDFSTTVIMQTEMDAVVEPVGWLPWVSNVEPPNTIFYGEYLNTGPGAGVEKRVNWTGYKPTITPDEAGRFTVDSFIQGKEWLQQANVMFDSSL